MSLRRKSLGFTKKPLFLVTAFAILDKSVFAQLASSVTQSSNLLNQNNSASEYFLIFTFGAFFCASIFWWRREKSKEETLDRRSSLIKGKVKKGNEQNLPHRNPKSAGDRIETEVNADVATWIQNNIENSKQDGNGHSGMSRRPINPESFALGKAALVFQLPPSPDPIVPLPVSDDKTLIEAIEKIKPFNATEDERETAISVLVNYKSRNSVEALTQVAHYDESARLRIAALSGLGEFNHESVFEPVLLTCADPAREVRAAAARTYARLSVNRAEAYTRIVESEDPERLRLASMVCIDSGLAQNTLARLAHHDKQQADDAFAMVRLLSAAGHFALITEVISNKDVKAGLVMVKALQVIKPMKMVPALYHLTTVNEIAPEVRKALSELVAELSALK